MAQPADDAEFKARLEALEAADDKRSGSTHGKRDREILELVRYAAAAAGIVLT